jgi:putative membrane protein
MYLYVKALHIIFVVTWFAGLFYVVRLFVYNAEANEKSSPESAILQAQYTGMIRRLWLGITWPSAVATLVFGTWMLYLYGSIPSWLWLKLCFVAGLYAYHLSLQRIYRQQMRGIFRYSAMQLRLWNEAATVFLAAIVFIVVLKDTFKLLWGLAGLVLLVLLLTIAVWLYKVLRERKRDDQSS